MYWVNNIGQERRSIVVSLAQPYSSRQRQQVSILVFRDPAVVGLNFSENYPARSPLSARKKTKDSPMVSQSNLSHKYFNIETSFCKIILANQGPSGELSSFYFTILFEQFCLTDNLSSFSVSRNEINGSWWKQDPEVQAATLCSSTCTTTVSKICCNVQVFFSSWAFQLYSFNCIKINNTLAKLLIQQWCKASYGCEGQY